MYLNFLRLSFFVALLSLVACGGDDVVGTGPSVTRTLDVDAFSELFIEGSFDLTIRQGDSLEVIATGQANVIDVINTSVANSTWNLTYTVNNVRSEDLSIAITVPTISRIEADGSNDINLGAFTDQNSLNMSIDGSGDIDVTGDWTDLESLNLSIDGSGDIDGFPLNATDARIEIDGSGEIDVTATNMLDINIDGSGTVRYKGSPAITQSISGSGEIIDAN